MKRLVNERQMQLNVNCTSVMSALDALGTLERQLRLHANCALAVNTLEAIGALERQMRLNANCALAVDALEALSKKSSRSFGGKSSCECDLALGPLHSLKRRIRTFSGVSIVHLHR